jgi:hypothetical protein
MNKNGFRPSGALGDQDMEEAIRAAIREILSDKAINEAVAELTDADRPALPFKKPNRSIRRELTSRSSFMSRFLGFFLDTLQFEVNLKIRGLLREGNTDEEKRANVDKAFASLHKAVEAVEGVHQSQTPPDDVKLPRLPPALEAFVAKFGVMAYTVFEGTGNFERMGKMLDRMEKLTPRFAIDFMHQVASSKVHNTAKDRNFTDYFARRMEAFFRIDAAKTWDIAKKIMEDEAGNADSLEHLQPVISFICEKMPALYLLDRARGAEAISTLGLFVEFTSRAATASTTTCSLFP